MSREIAAAFVVRDYTFFVFTVFVFYRRRLKNLYLTVVVVLRPSAQLFQGPLLSTQGFSKRKSERERERESKSMPVFGVSH